MNELNLLEQKSKLSNPKSKKRNPILGSANSGRKSEGSAASDGLYEAVAIASQRAGNWLFTQQKADGHWVAELESNSTITAEYVFMCQGLGINIPGEKKEKIIRYFLKHQKNDGSWGIAWNHEGDVSTTVEVYLALRLLGFNIDTKEMERAQKYVLHHGGIAKVRIFTRINLACFGLFPWDAIPVVPAEFILMPARAPINIYRLSSWARSTMVPLFITLHHKPIFALPNGRSANNGWLDHLWVDAGSKNIPYSAKMREILKKEGLSARSFFVAADKALRTAGKAKNFAENVHYSRITKGVATVFVKRAFKKFPWVMAASIVLPKDFSLRDYALKKSEEWILRHQEEDGDWAGIFPPMVNGVIALCLNGHGLDSPPVKKGLQAIERFGIDDEEGFRIQACVSPVWDTVLSLIGFLDCGFDAHDSRFTKAVNWVRNEQILVDHGDWKVYNPKGKSGGWAFEYKNTWYPDVDDTAAVVIAMLKQDPSSAEGPTVRRAVEWMVSMQNKDGGWAAFDKENNKTYMNEIPFSDMDSLCDPSTPDVTGRVLEALGILNDPQFDEVVRRGMAYLRKTQEMQGSWYGRWGVNYIYGTSNVLCALARLSRHLPKNDEMVVKGVEWLRNKQNADGGWGESLESYRDKNLMGEGPSTASQTAWALMGLLAFSKVAGSKDRNILAGTQWLVDRQTKDGFWDEPEFTGTGFPNHFYLRYHFYRHYFPMMALGRFLSSHVQ